jgi:hypothetical protein
LIFLMTFTFAGTSMTRPIAHTFVVLTLAILWATASTAQDAPAGSCMVPSGEWCWPIAPLTYGDPCECPTPDGGFEAGIVQ